MYVMDYENAESNPLFSDGEFFRHGSVLDTRTYLHAIYSQYLYKMGITVSPADADGEFRRAVTVFRDVIEEGGQFPPEKGRYHLYVSLACPWGII
jgi:hypothetical protein